MEMKQIGKMRVNLEQSQGRSRPRRSPGFPRLLNRRFFNIAKGSSYEVAAVMDVAQAFGFITDEVHRDGVDRCDHIGAMLSRFR